MLPQTICFSNGGCVLEYEGQVAFGPFLNNNPGGHTGDSRAAQYMEPVVHAGGQEQVAMARVPLQTPDSPANPSLCQRLPHVSRVPQQHRLVIAIDVRNTVDVPEQVTLL